MTRPALEVAQIFRHHGPDYRENQRLSPVQHKAMRDIERCRTARKGKIMTQPTLRLSLPSKGRLQDDALNFLADTGLPVHKPNPRQYQAEVPALPELGIILQRPGDIVVSVRQGSVDFGITGH